MKKVLVALFMVALQSSAGTWTNWFDSVADVGSNTVIQAGTSGTNLWEWSAGTNGASGVLYCGIKTSLGRIVAVQMPQPLNPEGVANLLVNYRVYDKNNNLSTRCPQLQVEVSTNRQDANSWLAVGAPFTLHTRTPEGWADVERAAYFPSLDSATALYFRLKVITPTTFVSLDDVKVDWFSAEAVATVFLASNKVYASGIETTKVTYADAPVLGLTVTPVPSSSISNLTITAYCRDDGATNWQSQVMTNHLDGTYRTPELSRLPAGVQRDYYFTADYDCDLPNSGQVRFPADTNSFFSYTVSGAGSVWINEIYANGLNGYIELCAATNRPVVSDWQLVVKNQLGQTQDIFQVSSGFTNNAYHGYGFYEQTNVAAPSAGSVLLLNDYGHIEHELAFSGMSDGLSYAATGAIPPPEEISSPIWELFYTNFSFAVSSGGATEGAKNADQKFTIQSSYYIESLVRDSKTLLPLEKASVIMTSQPDSGVAITRNLFTDSNGICAVSGTLANDDTNLDWQINAASFGYNDSSIVSNLIVSQTGVPWTNAVTLDLLPGIARDPFDPPALADYWTITGNTANVWGYSDQTREAHPDSNGGAGLLRYSNGDSLPSEWSTIRTANSLVTSSNKTMVIDFDYTTRSNLPVRLSAIDVQITTNSWLGANGTNTLGTVQTLGTTTNETWRHVRYVFQKEELASARVGFGFRAYYYTAFGVNRIDSQIDDLEIRFIADLTVGRVGFTPDALMYTDGLGFSCNLSPSGEGITNVQTRLVYRRNGGSWQESAPVELSGGHYPFTNTVAVSDAGAIPAGTFEPGDIVAYYLKVTYDMTEEHGGLTNIVKYYPDNLTDVSATVKKADGEYAPVPRSAVAQDLKRVWINEVYYNPADSANHFVELAGKASLSLTNYTVEVTDLNSNKVTGTYRFTTNSLNMNISGSVGFNGIGLGLGRALTNALPVSGLIRIYNPSSQCVDAVAYGTNAISAPGATAIGHDAANGRLIATGAGPVSNGEFVWAGTNTASVGSINPNQSFTDTSGPQIIDPGVEISNIQRDRMTVTPSTAIDFSTPIEYKLTGGNLPVADWTNALTQVTDTNLAENTQYSYTVYARDALSNESTKVVSAYTAISAPTNISKSAATTNSMTVAVNTLPNLGSGQSAVLFVRDGVVSVTNGSTSAAFSGLSPNQQYSFVAQSRNGDGVLASGAVTGTFYTAAASAPVPGATIAGPRKLDIQLNKNNDNPLYTEYALVYTNDLAQTWFIAANGTQNTNAPAWTNTWPATVTASGLQGALLSVATLVRNGDGEVTYPMPGAATNVEFVITAEITNAVQRTGGLVDIDVETYNFQTDNAQLRLVVSNETTGVTNAMVLTGVSAAYSNETVFITNGQPYQVDGIRFDSNAWNSVHITWDAKADGFDGYNSNVTFFVEIDSTNAAALTQKRGDSRQLTIDMLPPLKSATSLTGVPGLTNTTAATITVVNPDIVEVQYSLNSGGWVLTNKSFTLTGLANWTNTLGVIGADLAGNWMATSNAVSTNWVVDTLPPQMTTNDLSGVPAGTVTNTSATLTIQNSDVASYRYRTSLNGGAWTVWSGIQSGSWPLQRSGLLDGTNSVAIIGYDTVGNVMAVSNALIVSWVVDTIAPSVVLSTPVGSPFSNATFTVTAAFSEAVTNFIAGDVSVGNGVASAFTAVSSSNYTFTVTPSAQGPVTVNVAAGACTDPAGNPNTVAAQLSRTFDNVQPSVVLSTPAGSPFSNATFTVTAAFSEAVTNFIAGDVTVSNGVASAFTAVSSSNYTFTITPSGQGAVTVNVGAGVCTDAALNPNTAATALVRTYDTVSPGVTLTTPVGNSFSNATFTVTAAFSEAVTGFTNSDVVVLNGTLSAFSGSGTNYTFTVTPTAQGAVSVNVAAGVCADLAQNPNLAATTLSKTFDNVQPSVVLSTPVGSPFSNATFTVTALFSETVTGFTSSDVVVLNGTLSAFSGSGTNYTFTVTPTAQGAVSVNVAAGVCADLAQNPNLAATPLGKTFDNVPPAAVVLINAPAGLVNSGTAVIEVSATNDVASYIYRKGHGNPVVWDAAGWSDRIPVASNTVFTGLTAGPVRVEVYGYDMVGNETVNPAIAEWIVNITPPEWLSPGPVGDGTFTLNWTPPVNGDGYRLLVASDTNFTSLVVSNEITGLETDRYDVSGLNAGSTNYCRMQTLLGASSSSWGEILRVIASDDTPGPVNRLPKEITVTLGGSDVWNLNDLFGAAGLTFTAVSDSPAVVSTALASGLVTFDYLSVGTATVTLRAQNSASSTAEVSVIIHVVSPASAPVSSISGNPVFIPQLNRYGQTVTITNNTGSTVQAIKLIVTGITPSSVILLEATSQNGGNAEIIWNGELAAGESIDFNLTYYNPAKTPITITSITAEFSLVQILPEVVFDPAPVMIANGGVHRDLSGVGIESFLLEFPTVKGAVYYVFYRESLVTGDWIRVQKPVIAHGTWYMWYDPGAPVTAPRGVSRFYKVEKAQ